MTEPHDPNIGSTRAQQLFWAALEQAPDRRAAWLADVEAPDEVVAEVRSLLAYHGTRDGLLATPAVERPTSAGDDTHAEDLLRPLERLGDYRVERVIASGGMGTVYLARQASPERLVAIKVMHRGSTSTAARRRFAFEAEALARLRHPAIAQIHEAVLPDGDSDEVPYLVMEYVPEALPITLHAAKRRLDRRALLELFGQVCEGVHHGHQRGIIHRDLKPANILVNGEGRPKLIDFGVARLVDRGDDGQTRDGQMVGTLAYMAPEQVAGTHDDLDTRADVYALGAVLYELLTGRTPHELSDLPVAAASRRILDEDPPRPAHLDGSLAGDLDVIITTAMARDREQRYRSASALAADVERHLSWLPITARPPSLTYHLMRFAQRNRALVTGLVVGVLGLVVATVLSLSYGLREARLRSEAERAEQRAVQARADETRAREAAELARTREAGAREEAEAARDEALRQRAEARVQRSLAAEARTRAESETLALGAVLDFFVGDVLTAADAAELEGRTLTVREALDRAATRLDEQVFSDRPRVEAGIRLGIGEIYSNLGLFDDGLPHLERALQLRRDLPDVDAAALAATLRARAIAHQGLGRLDAARLDVEEALALWEPSGVVPAAASQGAGAPRAADAGTRRREHADVLLCAASLARDTGDVEGGLTHVRRARELIGEDAGPLDPDLLTATVLEASLLEAAGDVDGAYTLMFAPLQRLLAGETQDSLTWVRVTRPLAALMIRAGDLEQARELLGQTLAHSERLHGSEHEAVARCLNTRGHARYKLRDFAGAAADFDRALALFERRLGRDHTSTLVTRVNRAALAIDTQDWSTAEAQLTETVSRFEGQDLAGHQDCVRARAFLGEVYWRLDRHAEAEAQLLAGWDVVADDDSTTAFWLRYLIVPRLRLLYTDWGRQDEADRWHAREDEFAVVSEG